MIKSHNSERGVSQKLLLGNLKITAQNPLAQWDGPTTFSSIPNLTLPLLTEYSRINKLRSLPLGPYLSLKGEHYRWTWLVAPTMDQLSSLWISQGPFGFDVLSVIRNVIHVPVSSTLGAGFPLLETSNTSLAVLIL